MMIDHWMTVGLSGANGSFQRAAREYAEEYSAMVVAAARERAYNAGFVEASRIHGDESERMRKDAERYRWLRDHGGVRWLPFQHQWQLDAAQCDNQLDEEMQRAFGDA